MTKAMRLLAAGACVILLMTALSGPAYGFFPKGGYNFTQQLRYATWPFREFDTNGNGAIEPGEGLEFRIESGPRGFTNAEIEQVRAGFQVWQDVPTSYVAFRFVGNIEDPIAPGTVGPDYLPMVFMQVTDIAPDDGFSQPDGTDVIIPGLSAFVPALTILTYAIDTTVIEVAGTQVIIAAGTILDCDIVVNASVHRAGVVPATTFGPLDLQATITHHVGQLLGLAYTPLNNLDPFNSVTQEGAELGLPVEPAVLQITGPDGVRRMLGATPTMFPVYFLTEMPSGAYVAGWRDLAPDDISGVSWLYPRQDGLENFFSIKQEARTQVRRPTGVPSAPISGAHVVAWASLSSDESAPRVPLFSTMTGLYQKYFNEQLAGRFNLMGLWKQMEVPGRVNEKFEPSYVLTMNPLNGLGLDRQAPPDLSAEDFDSLQGAFPLSYSTLIRPAGTFSTNYPSEVFNEFGNIYGIDNNSAGTPLVWSFTKNTVVSRHTDKTLPAILPRTTPMFGDPDEVCFFNLIEEGGETGDGGSVFDGLGGLIGLGIDSGGPGAGGSGDVLRRLNNRLRAFRDNVLLKSASGTALVDLYYRTAPFLVHHLTRHDSLLRTARGAVLIGVRIAESGGMMLMLLLMVAAGALALRLRTRTARVAVMCLLVLAVGASAAFAGQMPVSTENLVAQSSYIFTGEVIAAEGRMGRDNRIYTDVSVRVRDVAKGNLNSGSTFSFSVLGGIYGTIATTATGIPGFSVGEQALMYFKNTQEFGVIPFGGYRSKVNIVIDPVTGEEMLVSDGTWEDDVQSEDKGLAEDAETGGDEGENEGKSARKRPTPPETTPTGMLPLREYMRYLRALAHSQR